MNGANETEESDQSAEPIEEVNEYAIDVWERVARKLCLTGFKGVGFNVLSGRGAPFKVEVTGPPGLAAAVVNPGFRPKLRFLVREALVEKSGDTRTLSRGEDWPDFHITVSRGSSEMGKAYIPGGFSGSEEADESVTRETTTRAMDRSAMTTEQIAKETGGRVIEEGVIAVDDPDRLETVEKEDNPPTFKPDPDGSFGQVVMVYDSEPETVPQTADELTPDPTPSEELGVFSGRLAAILRDEGSKLIELLIEKNRAYGNSVDSSAQVFRVLYPNGITPDQYSDMLIMVRIFDKMKRIATKKDAFGENPFRDIAGYSLLACALEMIREE